MKLNFFILNIVILPILGSIVAGLLGRKIGIKGSHIITCSSLIISSFLISYAFYNIVLCGNEAINLNLGSWVDSGILNINWEFKFDNLSLSLGLAVLYCSTLIHIYSISYLESDPQIIVGRWFKWVKLSNSGESLKLLILNHVHKNMSGWSNYSGMVKTQEMSENEMGNRGSKSDNLLISVKEQRVDGSYLGYKSLSYSKLRCILMGGKNRYQIKIPSKQFNVKKFSTANNNINPWFWSGFIDAEGSFSNIIDKNKDRKLGWRIQSKFQLGLHKRDLPLILQFQRYLGGIGSVHLSSTKNMVNFSIDSIKDLINLINHFEKYPLQTQKAADFLLFKQVVNIMVNKDHLSIEGLHQIINIKASMNLGLSDFLKSEFKEFTPVSRPIINTKNIPDPNWISGFVSGDGNFDVKISQSTNKLGYRVQLRFRITQHIRDIELMELLVKYFGSGMIYKYSNNNAVSITISNFTDITETIIPFFNNNPLLGIKYFDYIDWVKVVKLMSEGSHLTPEGLNLIREIKSGMNKGRSNLDI